MTYEENLRLNLRSQLLVMDAAGHTIWQEQVVEKSIPASQTAIIICDVWDNHWSRGAAERVDAMAPRMNQVVLAARRRGVQIIHAPSDTIALYAQTEARQRLLAVPRVEPPPPLPHDEPIPNQPSLHPRALQSDPPLPIDDSDHGSDTGAENPYSAWIRQHPAIEIRDEDGISDDGLEIYSFLQHGGIKTVLIMGVHTNMCVLNRSFGIKSMVRWGVDIALVRDLTDTMYNPARRPYVSHDEGTRLVIGYIEKFWCPSVSSEDIVGR